jgi:hypothetical protein
MQVGYDAVLHRRVSGKSETRAKILVSSAQILGREALLGTGAEAGSLQSYLHERALGESDG